MVRKSIGREHYQPFSPAVNRQFQLNFTINPISPIRPIRPIPPTLNVERWKLDVERFPVFFFLLNS